MVFPLPISVTQILSRGTGSHWCNRHTDNRCSPTVWFAVHRSWLTQAFQRETHYYGFYCCYRDRNSWINRRRTPGGAAAG